MVLNICSIFCSYTGIDVDKFNFIKIWKSFPTVFSWIWSLISDSTKPNDLGFVKNFDTVSQCEDETKKC